MSTLEAPGSQSSDQWYDSDDSTLLEALRDIPLPGDPDYKEPPLTKSEPPQSSQPSLKRRHELQPDDEIYGEAHFGDFGEYMLRKRAKLQIQNADINKDGPSSNIFQGLAIYINGYTNPSIQDLRELIVKHGGVFQPYLDKKSIVTHIITCNLTPAKMKEFKNMKVVKPEWLVQSAEQGMLLPWQDFIYQPIARSEIAQGVKNTQKSLDALYKTDLKPSKDALRAPHYASHESNPNAQRAMANEEWRNTHTSVAPDFVEGYYKNSRLHHLSTWKSELRNLVQEAQDRAEKGVEGKVKAEDETPSTNGVSMRGAEFALRSPSKGKGKEKEVPAARVIMHCDFDCFFVSAGLTKRPELRGKPVVVCHSQGGQGGTSSTSEIASASYEARNFGIKNGMSLQQARKLCPNVATIPYEFELYKQFSLKFYTILMLHADDLQAVSVDEALIDVSTTVRRLKQKSSSSDSAKDFAETIRAEIRKATGCEVSIGIAHNILLARLATRKAKPAGSYHVLPEGMRDLLLPLDISDLPGFGWSAKQKAKDKLGATTLGELIKKNQGVLCDVLGKSMGETLWRYIRGIDDRKLESDKPRKSVSCEINYGIRFQNNEQAESFIQQMGTEVAKRLNEAGMQGGSITLKVMKRDPTAPVEPPKFMGHGACETFSKQSPLTGGLRATADARSIGDQAWRLLKSFNFDPKELRGLGIQIQKLEPASKHAQTGAGRQARLPFQRKPDFLKPPAKPKSYSAMLPPPVPASAANVPGPSTMKPADPLELPSFSQVDKSVFNALPLDIRKELEGEYKRRTVSPLPPPVAPVSNGKANISSLFLRNKPRPPRSIFPSRSQMTPNLARIAAALQPRNPAFMPKKLKNMMTYRGVRSMHLTDEEFRRLNIDPAVLMALPKHIRNEQIVRARLIKNLGAVPKVSGERKILRRPLPPRRYYPRLPNPKAKYLQPALLRQQGKEKGEKLYFVETDDIQNVIEAWVERYKKFSPHAKDVEFFSKFLCQSVDAKLCSDQGVIRAVAIVKWWLVLLRRTWGAYDEKLGDVEGSPGSDRDKTVGLAWWKAFRDVKAQMDQIARKRFGGKLSLR